MKYWLIGCGILLVIAVILGGFGVYYVFKVGQEVGAKLQEIAKEYDQLDQEFPFLKPAEGLMESPQVARFVSVHRKVSDSFDLWENQLRSEETSWWTKVTSAVDMIPALAQSHVDALREQSQGPSEYLWTLDQILLVLKYAEIPEFPEELKAQLPQDAHDQLRRIRTDYDKLLTDYDQEPTFGSTNQQDPTALLPSIDPSLVKMHAQNIQAVLDNAAGIRETVRIFFFYDLHFKNTYYGITRGAARTPQANPGEEGKK